MIMAQQPRNVERRKGTIMSSDAQKRKPRKTYLLRRSTLWPGLTVTHSPSRPSVVRQRRTVFRHCFDAVLPVPTMFQPSQRRRECGEEEADTQEEGLKKAWADKESGRRRFGHTAELWA